MEVVFGRGPYLAPIKQRTGDRSVADENCLSCWMVKHGSYFSEIYFDTDASFEAFTAVMFHVEVFWIVTPCNVVGYQRFRGVTTRNTSTWNLFWYYPHTYVQLSRLVFYLHELITKLLFDVCHKSPVR